MVLRVDASARSELTALLTELTGARRRRGDLPQQLLAGRLSVATSSLADWEAGRDSPTTVHMILWARELGLRLTIIDQQGHESDAAITPADSDRWEVHEMRRMATALRTERLRQGVLQASLAAQLEMTRRSIVRLERAQGYPRPIGLVVWARTLDRKVRLRPM